VTFVKKIFKNHLLPEIMPMKPSPFETKAPLSPLYDFKVKNLKLLFQQA